MIVFIALIITNLNAPTNPVHLDSDLDTMKAFFDLNKPRITGHYSAQNNKNTSPTVYFSYTANGVRFKLEESLKFPKESAKHPEIMFSEYYSDEMGFYTSFANQSGNFIKGYGHLFNRKENNLGVIFSGSKNTLLPISGNFAITIANSDENPCYSFEELIKGSNLETKDGLFENKPASILSMQSKWGNLVFWIDKNHKRPFKVESYINKSGVMATGLALEKAQYNSDYKTNFRKDTYIYFYNINNPSNFPEEITVHTHEEGLYKNDEEITTDQTILIKYDRQKLSDKPVFENFRISSCAKNGTPFPITNHPQIAYHLEEGHLVLSANHKFLNKISQTVFGSPGFWQRLTLILVPLILSTALGLFLWKRWKPKPT